MTPSFRRRPAFAATTVLVAALATAACTSMQRGNGPVVWDGKTQPPAIAPLLVDGRCSLVVSGTTDIADKAIGRVSLAVEEGVAQVDVALAPPDAHGSRSFHVVVPVEEQHVDVIYVGRTSWPVWERAHGGKLCD